MSRSDSQVAPRSAIAEHFSRAGTGHVPSPRDGELLARLEDALELPMILLGLVWLVLAAVELVTTLPWWLEHVATGIWMIFVADFVLRLWLADARRSYLRDNWLVVVALALPALRVFRLVRVAALARRGLRLARMATTFGRARRSIHHLLARRHSLGYVIALTTVVIAFGAAGMLAFEREATPAFASYGYAVWWTAMLLTTMGSDAWPATFEGRMLCLVLSLYGFAVFGYITATLASWLVGRERKA